MKVNFFESACKEPSRTDSIFGICDDQDGRKAYTDSLYQDKWIATVKNENFKSVVFTPIDNCISVYKVGTKDKEGSCDGMITYAETLILLELKDQGTGGWLPQAKKQLKNSIRLLHENHDLKVFKYKKAYACNKRHPNFIVIDVEAKRRFFKETDGFRIDAQSEILIK